MRTIIGLIIIMIAGPALAQAREEAAIQRAVRNALRDPSSARFVSIRVFDTTDMRGRPVRVACGSVSARTSGGGPSDAIPFVYLSNGASVHFLRPGIGLNDSIDRQLGAMVYGNFCNG